mgnify:CR=1 FL=1
MLNKELDIVEFLKKIRRFEAFRLMVTARLNLEIDHKSSDHEMMQLVSSDNLFDAKEIPVKSDVGHKSDLLKGTFWSSI